MVARIVETWTLDCSHTTAIKVSSEGRPGEEAELEGKPPLTGVAGGVGGAGMVVEHAMTDDVRSAR
jgi:hypothetical protein